MTFKLNFLRKPSCWEAFFVVSTDLKIKCIRIFLKNYVNFSKVMNYYSNSNETNYNIMPVDNFGVMADGQND